MREWIQNNSAVITIASIVVIVIVLALRFLPAKEEFHNSDGFSDQSWYYDVNTGTFFQDRLDRVPPFTSPRGNEAVRVVFFSCGACTEAERFPGFFLKHTTELKQTAEADPNVAAALGGEKVTGRLYSFDGKTWIEAAGPEEAGVFERYRNKCDGGGALKICR